jgi:anti-sigma factor RsiW
MTSFTRRIPDTLLQFYLTDELGPEERARVEEALAASPPDLERLKELRAAAEDFLQRTPAERLVDRFREEVSQSFTAAERERLRSLAEVMKAVADNGRLQSELRELRERSSLLEALVLHQGVESIVLA